MPKIVLSALSDEIVVFFTFAQSFHMFLKIIEDVSKPIAGVEGLQIKRVEIVVEV